MLLVKHIKQHLLLKLIIFSHTETKFSSTGLITRKQKLLQPLVWAEIRFEFELICYASSKVIIAIENLC